MKTYTLYINDFPDESSTTENLESVIRIVNTYSNESDDEIRLEISCYDTESREYETVLLRTVPA